MNDRDIEKYFINKATFWFLGMEVMAHQLEGKDTVPCESRSNDSLPAGTRFVPTQ